MPEMSSSDIKYLLQQVALNNDETSYRQLFNIYFPTLKRFAYCIVKSNEVAEEVASDAMINIWRNRQQLEAIKNIKVYLLVAVRNLCLNHLKKNASGQTVSLDDIDFRLSFDMADPEESFITSEMKRKLEAAVQTLPPRCKMIFKLVKEEGLSYKEVAELLNISVKTVDAHLVTAITKITQAIKVVYNVNL